MYWFRDLSSKVGGEGEGHSVAGRGCPCSGVKGWGLVKCLAPPRGEYEVHIPVYGETVLVINEDGFFLRSINVEEVLPFMATRDRPVDPEALSGLVDAPTALCQAVEALLEASRHLSVSARRKLEACSELVERVVAECGKKGMDDPGSKGDG